MKPIFASVFALAGLAGAAQAQFVISGPICWPPSAAQCADESYQSTY